LLIKVRFKTSIFCTKAVQQLTDRQRFSEHSRCRQFRRCSTVLAPGNCEQLCCENGALWFRRFEQT